MNFRIVAAPESVKFASRKIEDMQSSEAAAQSEATKLSGVSSDLQSLQKKLEQIHRFLLTSQANWEHIIMDCEDVGKCTEIAILTFMNKVVDTTVPDIFKGINSKPVNFFALHKLKVDIQKIKSKVGWIDIEHLGVPSDRDITQSARRSLLNDSIWLLGLENHHKNILRRLVDQCHHTRSVVQVLGKVFAKAVLAEKIYQSAKVKNHFEACFWLFPPIRFHPTYSKPYLFEPIDIMRKMLSKLGDTNSLDASNNEIESRLSQYLYQKRCLIVVDNNCKELWDVVSTVFSDGNNGSRLLMITSEEEDSDYEEEEERGGGGGGGGGEEEEEEYKLPSLHYQDGLKLQNFGTKGFLESEEYPTDFFGAGSPTKPVLSGNQLLSYVLDDRHPMAWTYRDEWYSGLPMVLKTCILYTATVFPCGSIILADSLIQLWIVEGIIPHEEAITMDDIAESYLEQLVERGLLRIIRSYYHNNANHQIRSIILQPIVHYIINSQAHRNKTCNEEGFTHVTQLTSLDAFDEYNNPLHTDINNPHVHLLALHRPYRFNHISSFAKGPQLQCLNYPSLHSLFFFGYVAPVTCSPFNFLRVLAVFSNHIQFPEEDTPCWLDELINLRYLGFIVCLVECGSLGKTLDRLAKLEILDLSASIVSGLSEFIRNKKKVKVLGPDNEELQVSWSPIPDMSQ